MSELDNIRPRRWQRVIDLVQATGINTSDWANCIGGKEKAASNPKYCYNWVFIEPQRKLVVLCLWFENMQERDGAIMQVLNPRESARYSNHAVARHRALDMDRAIQMAFGDKLPIRVVILNGKRRDRDDPNAECSHVEKRLLDEVSWAVTTYNSNTGECTLTRDAPR